MKKRDYEIGVLSAVIIGFILVCTFAIGSVYPADFRDPAQHKPEYLKGKSYAIVSPEGVTRKFDTDKWKLVPRKTVEDKVVTTQAAPSKEDAAQVVAPEPEVIEKIIYVDRMVNLHSLKIFVGRGDSGVQTVDNNATKTRIEENHGNLLGLGYERQLTREISLEAIGVFDRGGVNSALIGVGYSFK